MPNQDNLSSLRQTTLLTSGFPQTKGNNLGEMYSETFQKENTLIK